MASTTVDHDLSDSIPRVCAFCEAEDCCSIIGGCYVDLGDMKIIQVEPWFFTEISIAKLDGLRDLVKRFCVEVLDLKHLGCV